MTTTMNVIECCPDLLFDRGLPFLYASRDEDIWNGALRQIKVRGVVQTLNIEKKTVVETAKVKVAI